MKALYTAQATATGGRDGHVQSSDNVLSLDVRIPKEMGGGGGAFTNPEQLFAAGYAACFDSALQFVARTKKFALKGSTVTAKVSLGTNGTGGFQLAVALDVKLEGLERVQAEELLNIAHQVCPYSNATRGNIDVTLNLL